MLQETRSRQLPLLMVLGAGCLFTLASSASAQPPSPYTTRNDLFYNYYVGSASNPDEVPAQMYVSPRPVPRNVGHTYVTYQPFMPHEYLYKHNRTYYSSWNGGGTTTTKVSYRRGPFWNYHFLRGPRVQTNPPGRTATVFGDRHFTFRAQPFTHYFTPMYGRFYIR